MIPTIENIGESHNSEVLLRIGLVGCKQLGVDIFFGKHFNYFPV